MADKNDAILQELRSIRECLDSAARRMRPLSTLEKRAGSLELELRSCSQRLHSLERRLKG